MANGFAFKEWIKFQSRWTRFICLSNENVNESKQHISRTSVRSLSVAGTRKTNTVKDSKILPIKICTNATQDVFSTVNIRHLSMTSCFHRYRQNKFDTDDSRSWDTDHEEDDDDFESEEDEDNLPNVPSYKEDQYILPAEGHRVLVLQPDNNPNLAQTNMKSNPEIKLDECCSLVHTLPKWKVVDKAICPFLQVDRRSKDVLDPGNISEIANIIKNDKSITAVFVGLKILSGGQLGVLQDAWGLPVYDRYTMVLQIFHTHAKSKTAKLQVALAEIPYLRSRLRGMHHGTLDQQRGALGALGGSGETLLQKRIRVLNRREMGIKKALQKVQNHRNQVREGRQKRSLPVVAVVGYTNAGKTSLIKAITQQEKLEPRDQLFATLDVTSHFGWMKHMNALFIDTVGFISDIPTSLIEAFSATLEDALTADVIIHVRDIHNPDSEAQKQNVLQTLETLNIPNNLRESIIEVCNKVDLGISDSVGSLLDDNAILVSAKDGLGISHLLETIENVAIKNTGRLLKQFKIPMMDAEMYGWLKKETCIVSEDLIAEEEVYIVKCIMTQCAYNHFVARFSKSKR